MIDKQIAALVEPQDTIHAPKEHLEIARDWALMMAAVGVAAAVIAAAVVAAYAALAPAWIQAPLFVAAGFAFVIGIGVLRALAYARQAIAVRLYEFQENQETLREIAVIAATQITSVQVRPAKCRLGQLPGTNGGERAAGGCEPQLSEALS